MNIFAMIALVLACLAAVAVLALGIVSMAKGGEFNEKYGNRLMRLRVTFQGLALGLLALAYFASQK